MFLYHKLKLKTTIFLNGFWYQKKNNKEKKCFKNGKILMVELEGKNLFSVLVFNKENQLLESFGRCCFDDSLKKKIF